MLSLRRKGIRIASDHRISGSDEFVQGRQVILSIGRWIWLATLRLCDKQTGFGLLVFAAYGVDRYKAVRRLTGKNH